MRVNAIFKKAAPNVEQQAFFWGFAKFGTTLYLVFGSLPIRYR
jgi:hypothetical protein